VNRMSGVAQLQSASTQGAWNAGIALDWNDDGDETGGPAFPSLPGPSGMSDQALEALFREQWGLPPLDESGPEPPTREQVLIQANDRNEDDFTEDEWDMVKVLRTMCRQATQQQSSRRKRRAAVEWLFVHGTNDPKHRWTFHLMCVALRARPWVIQTMVQHVWFRKALVPDPLPFLADPLPEALKSEAILCAWDAGETVLSQIWSQPGAVLTGLRQHTILTERAFDRAAGTLLQAGLLGQCMDRVWVSSRSANFIRPGQRVSWSRSFPGD